VKPPEFAIYWARELGTREDSLVQLTDGINSQVFKCGTDSCKWVIKAYRSHKSGERNRMQAEVEFLQYAQQVAPGQVPGLITVDATKNCIVLEHIEGQAYPAGVHPPDDDVNAAAIFFQNINSNPSLARQIIQQEAAEGFLSLREHIRNVRDRLGALGADHLNAELRPKANKLLSELKHQTNLVEARLEDLISAGAIEEYLDPDKRYISPSDFGFHNAIKTTSGVKFIDFEFAGWDDPAKTIADFHLQPQIPLEDKVSQLLTAINSEHIRIVQIRIKALKPVLRLKWICIILSVLRQERLEDMMATRPNICLYSLLRDRLNKADQMLALGN